MSETNKVRFHMPDGQAQRERDAEMAGGETDWSWAAIAWLYEHDAEVVEETADELHECASVRSGPTSAAPIAQG